MLVFLEAWQALAYRIDSIYSDDTPLMGMSQVEREGG